MSRLDPDPAGPSSKQSISGGNFIVAALLAPGIALTLFWLGTVLTDGPVTLGDAGRLVGSFLILWFMTTFWGFLPSLVFGGLMLVLLQRLWPGKPTALAFTAAGGVAAGLYVLTGLGVAGLSPGVAMFFAPWATPDYWGPDRTGEDWWLVASLLLAGTGAGLFYSTFVKRG